MSTVRHSRPRKTTAPSVEPIATTKSIPLATTALEVAIFSSSTFASIATDTTGLIQIINVGAQRLLGYAAEDVVNRLTVMDLAEPVAMAARAEALNLELGTPIRVGFEALTHKASRGIEDIFEIRLIRGDQARFQDRISVTALKSPQAAIIGFLLIVTDNTLQQEVEATRSEYERSLQLKNRELEDASRAKSEFLANMSHELRTPLNAIIGFSEVLRDGLLGTLPDRQRVCVDDIFSSGQHLLALINDILDLSKVEAGKMTLDLESVQVASLFANSLSIVREKAAERHIRLNIDVPPDLGSIAVDARKVKQILYNLLSNAVKFTLEGGAVTLHARRVARDDVGRLTGPWAGRALPLSDSTFDEFLRISVTDSGIGIPADALDRLFAPFSQIDSGLARQFEGTGLGLAMIRVLADLHGGAAGVESAPAKGSRFTVWLPARAPVFAVSPPVIAVSPAPEKPGTRVAMVVEDDPKSAGLIRVQLEAEGFQVVEAATAEAALVLALRQPLSLITLDIMLPSMDGWEFLGRIKQIPLLSHVPVVIISIVADRNKGIALGAAAVMQKPVSRQDLLQALIRLNLFPLSGQALKVLVVDNDPKAVELIASRFVGLASTTLRAYGGREAIETTRSELPDLIVLDLLMPEVTGFDVVEAIKDDPRTSDIPILVVTSWSLSTDDRERLNSHVTAILDKSDFSQRFLTEVHRAIASRKTPA